MSIYDYQSFSGQRILFKGKKIKKKLRAMASRKSGYKKTW